MGVVYKTPVFSVVTPLRRPPSPSGPPPRPSPANSVARAREVLRCPSLPRIPGPVGPPAGSVGVPSHVGPRLPRQAEV